MAQSTKKIIHQNVIIFRVVQAFSQSQLSQELENEIFDELDKLFDASSEVRVAVRSSAVGEDSEDLSAAGQNETFLGCKGKTSILQALLKCWASLFSFQSVEYRRYF